MTREEAKELLTHMMMSYTPKDQYGDYDDPEPYEEAIDMAIEALSAEAVHKWIPVSERLPDLHKTVIYSLDVETYDGGTYTGYRTDRNYSGEVVEPYWADLETGIEVFPNAWMPLPDPYKGGEDE